MRVLQWNMGIFKSGDEPETEQRRAKLLASLLREREPDLVALQEAPIELARQVLLDAGYEVATSAPRRRLVTGWHHSAWSGYAAQPLVYARTIAVLLTRTTATGNGERVLVCNVHLPAQAPYGSECKTSDSLKSLLTELQDFRRDPLYYDAAEIILGDFNLEPHASVLNGHYELAGSRSLDYVKRTEANRPQGERLRSFYNAAWRLYGVAQPPHGTLHYTGNQRDPWYVFDQAFFSGSLLTKLIDFKIITAIRRKSLLTPRSARPDKAVGSDHLPVLWLVK